MKVQGFKSSIAIAVAMISAATTATAVYIGAAPSANATISRASTGLAESADPVLFVACDGLDHWISVNGGLAQYRCSNSAGKTITYAAVQDTRLDGETAFLDIWGDNSTIIPSHTLVAAGFREVDEENRTYPGITGYHVSLRVD